MYFFVKNKKLGREIFLRDLLRGTASQSQDYFSPPPSKNFGQVPPLQINYNLIYYMLIWNISMI
jgi:hypothetical protein